MEKKWFCKTFKCTNFYPDPGPEHIKDVEEKITAFLNKQRLQVGEFQIVRIPYQSEGPRLDFKVWYLAQEEAK